MFSRTTACSSERGRRIVVVVGIYATGTLSLSLFRPTRYERQRGDLVGSERRIDIDTNVV